jgi:hypothetical protein
MGLEGESINRVKFQRLEDSSENSLIGGGASGRKSNALNVLK